jgi:hypothetical protein
MEVTDSRSTVFFITDESEWIAKSSRLEPHMPKWVQNGSADDGCSPIDNRNRTFLSIGQVEFRTFGNGSNFDGLFPKGHDATCR